MVVPAVVLVIVSRSPAPVGSPPSTVRLPAKPVPDTLMVSLPVPALTVSDSVLAAVMLISLRAPTATVVVPFDDVDGVVRARAVDEDGVVAGDGVNGQRPGLSVLIESRPPLAGTRVAVIAPVGVTVRASAALRPSTVIVAVAVTFKCSMPVKLTGPPTTPVMVLVSRLMIGWHP